MSPFDLTLYVLIASNLVLYALLAFGYFRFGLIRTPKISEAAVAFRLLEDALSRSFPDLPAGFTWSEGIAKAKSLKLKINWSNVDEMLSKYESFRYGEAGTLSDDPREVLKLAFSLPRKPKKI